MAKILISACLMGFKVRYDGNSQANINQALKDIIANNEILTFCPEVAGGLSTPRTPAEIQQGSGEDVLAGRSKVLTKLGEDVTDAFIKGAQLTLQYCQQHNIKYAILMERSPSCGSVHIYNGEFSGNKITGQGVTTALLREHGIGVFDQDNLPHLQQHLSNAKSV